MLVTCSMTNGHHLVNTFTIQEKKALMQQPPEPLPCSLFSAAFNLQDDETFTASFEIIHLNLAINFKLRIFHIGKKTLHLGHFHIVFDRNGCFGIGYISAETQSGNFIFQ